MEMARCQQYIDALEEERRKIQVFQRELPLCLQLVTQAIEACRQQLATEITSGPSESEETSSEGPVFEEFMPIKKESIDTQKKNQKEDGDDDGKGEKPDWLRSVQLWTTDFEASAKEDAESCPRSLSLANKKTGAFHPFCKERRPQSVAVISSSSPDSPSIVATPSSTGKQDEKEDKSQKKSRRCWSPELHHRFLHALHQLGGSHAATPKQIRELMKVDGLTNDEVKSHLQKYRLHTRRVPSNASIPMSNSQPTQFVVVGGIWVPPEFATVASSGPSGQAPETALSTVYAPSAKTPSPSVTTRVSAPQLKKESQLQPSEDPSSPSPRRGGDRSGSRGENSMGEDAISSSAVSSHTTTTTATSPAHPAPPAKRQRLHCLLCMRHRRKHRHHL